MSHTGGHFPDEKQTLLLKAALSERLKAIRYFAEWLEINQLDKLDPSSSGFLSDFMDSIDPGSQRLLPLVIHNLGENTHPYFVFLLGTRKNYWVKNKQITHKAFGIIKTLEQHGIPAMPMKGLDLANRFYENIAHRPMNDGDLLIPYQYREKVIELTKTGVFGNKTRAFDSKPDNLNTAIRLDFEGKLNIDLHWSIFREYAFQAHASDFIWQKATKTIIAGVTNYQMSATHALFLNIASGRSFDSVPPFRWVADAKKIMDKSTIDWSELLELCKTFPFRPFLKKAFTYLAEQHQFDIPLTFQKELKYLETNELEEKYYHAISINSRKYGFAGALWFITNRNIFYHKLFMKDTGISLTRFIFTWHFTKIKSIIS